MGHETKREPQAVGKAAAKGHCHAACRQVLPSCIRKDQGFHKFGCALVPDLSKERARGNPEPSQMGTAIPFNRSAEERIGKNTAERSHCIRIYHRSMDTKADCTANPHHVRSVLYLCGGLEASTPNFWMELPKAGTTCFAKKRKSHCILEKGNVALYKKKPTNLVPTWRFLTRAVSCLCRLFEKPGRQEGKHPSCATVTVMRRFRPLEALPSLLIVDVLDCMFGSMHIILRAGKLLGSCGICCVICVGRWCWSGMVAPFIKGEMLKASCKIRKDFMSTVSLDTHRNLIRLNMCGRTASVTCLTAHTKIRIAWGLIFAALSKEFIILRDSLSHALIFRSFLGHEGCSVSIIS